MHNHQIPTAIRECNGREDVAEYYPRLSCTQGGDEREFRGWRTRNVFLLTEAILRHVKEKCEKQRAQNVESRHEENDYS